MRLTVRLRERLAGLKSPFSATFERSMRVKALGAFSGSAASAPVGPVNAVIASIDAASATRSRDRVPPPVRLERIICPCPPLPGYRRRPKGERRHRSRADDGMPNPEPGRHQAVGSSILPARSMSGLHRDECEKHRPASQQPRARWYRDGTTRIPAGQLPPGAAVPPGTTLAPGD